MKKTIIYFVLLLSICSRGFSQDVDIYWGKFNAEDRFARTELIGKRGDYLFGYKLTRNQTSILRYSLSDLQVNGEYPILGKPSKDKPGKMISDDYTFNSIVTLKDFFYISVTKYDRKTKENSLYMQEIDNTGKLAGNLKKVESIDSKSKFNRGTFDLIESDDSTKLLLVDYPPYDKYAGEKFTFTTYDEGLNVLKKSEVELPFKDKYFDLNDITYGKDGNVYMMAKITLDRKEKTKGEAEYYYELISINTAGDGSVLQYEIKLPQKYIDGISFDVDDSKDVICSGFYGNTTGVAKGDISGIFFMRINKTTKQVDATGLKDLDKDFVASLTSARRANKGKGISNDFKINDFIRRSDGGNILVAELAYQYVVTTTTTDSHGGMHTESHTHYVRNNIVAININPDGSIKWYANIPKYQHTVDDGAAYSSYFMATKADKMYFVYNDNADNMDPARIKEGKNSKVMVNASKSTAVLVQLGEDGQFTKTTLFSNKDNKVALMPSSHIMTSQSEVIVPAYNPGFWCCVSFSPAKSKLARFDFK
ncbi:MAG TPA: hypothetical protein VK783_15400 [Bacteroidia bacterium]|jgi:hypothetical protein|nr:hypothetical protein [Bacteroidia bacterium]